MESTSNEQDGVPIAIDDVVEVSGDALDIISQNKTKELKKINTCKRCVQTYSVLSTFKGPIWQTVVSRSSCGN